MVADQNVVVASYLSVLGEEVVWLPTLRRVAFDWEIPRLAQLLDRLHGVRLNLGLEDHRVWVNGNDGLLTVKSCYEFLANVGEEDGPWKAMWYPTMPLKVQFFLWMAALDKISTMNMLWRKGFFLPSMCLFCCQHME